MSPRRRVDADERDYFEVKPKPPRRWGLPIIAAVASLPGGPDRRVAFARDKPVATTISRDGVGTIPVDRNVGIQYVGYSQETGHNIPDVFWSFMYGQGAVAVGDDYQQRQLFDPVFVIGYPITEAYWARVKVKNIVQDVLIQCFERRCLTYTPGNVEGWKVEMGNVGRHYYDWRYNSAQVVFQALSPASVSNATPKPRHSLRQLWRLQ